MSTTMFPPKARAIFMASALLLALLLVLSFLRGDASAAPPAPGGGTGKSAGGVPGCWTSVPMPDTPGMSSYLNDVAAVSTSDVWAAGYMGDPDPLSRHPLLQHWDGTAWSIVPAPPVAVGELNGMSAVASDDIWAVGSAGSSGLILRWNGTQWNSVSGPTLVPLGSVSALSSNDVWVTYVYSSNGRIPSHWDGSSWTSYEIYNAVNLAHRSKVKAITHDQAWILRSAGQRISVWPVFSHWTGHSWNSVSAPSSQERHLLYDLDGVEPHDVYAVGHNSLSGTLIEHWDGYNWSIVPSPGGTGGEAGLQGVVTLSSSDAWAVGYEPFEGNLLDKSLVAVHFDGQTWDLVDIPNPGQSNLLHEVDALSSDDVWAVGEYSDASGTFHPLAMHYTAPCANPIPTSTPAPTATPEPPPCPGETFTDVCPSDYFYTAAKALADDGIIAGYNTSPPCNNDLWIPCFKPYNTTTRAQISKVVSLAANFTEPVSGQTFEDVAPGSTFYEYIERMAAREIISGYPCGGPDEPCGPGNRPYFRPGNNVTRGQLSKMTAQAFSWSDPVTGQPFEDVPPDSTFYEYVERLYNRAIINGYACGSPGEPCVLPGNRPYFRPNSNVLRGQTAKIVHLSRTQPTATPTAEPTSTPTAIVTAEATSTPVEATATTGPNRQPTR